MTESVADGTGTSAAEVARLQEERDRLEAEVRALRARQEAGRGPGRGGRPRRVVTALLVALACIVVTMSVVGIWARRNALDTDRWVETVGPVGEDPAVQAALARWTTDEVMGLVDVEAYAESVLPDRGDALAGPLANAVRGFVRDRVEVMFASDTFEQLWREGNRRAHARVVAVLEGDTGNLRIDDGEVHLDVVPIIERVVAQVADASPEVFGRTIELPPIDVDAVSEQAISRLEDAFGRDLPDDFGQFTVFEARRLEEVQDTVALVQRLLVVTVVAGVALVGLALWVSPHRRRTLIQLAVGIALGVVLVRRVGIRLEGEVVELARPENEDAVQVAVGAFVSSLLDATATVLAVVTAVLVVALLTGPYAWARWLRRRAAAAGRVAVGVVRAAAAGGDDDGDRRVPAWVTAHRDVLQLGGIVVTILLLLLIDVSWAGLLVLAVALGAFLLVLSRLAPDPVAPP